MDSPASVPTEEKLREQLAAERRRFERQLDEKNAALQAAFEDVEALAYAVSHDLRSPLRAVSGFVAMAEKAFNEQTPDAGVHALQRVRANTALVGALIDGLVTFSRLGQQSIHKIFASPEAIVRGALADLHPQFEGRHVEITIGELPACRADVPLLKQVYVNLLSNAAKYTIKRESAVITVGCNRETHEAVYFVRDNGVGFDMRYADKLFQVFRRLHSAEEFEGAGIGLAIVRRIVQRHGGRIWAEAAPDRGATFYFTLG